MTVQGENTISVRFRVEGLKQELYVLLLEGEERLSSLYRFELELACAAGDLAFARVVGRQATVTVTCRGQDRRFGGILSRIQQHGTGPGFTRYRATLVPRAWRLLQGQDSRIFQRLSADAIAGAILEKENIKHSFHIHGNQTLASREYCVQYREPSWAFISRLMEEEGVYSFFDHQSEEPLLRLGNSPTFHTEMEGGATLAFHPPDALVPAAETVSSFFLGQAVVPGRLALRDHNLDKPALELQVQEEGSGDSGIEVYDFPGGYQLPRDGKQRAEVRLQEAQVPGLTGGGTSDCPRLAPGKLFSLEHHPRGDFNGRRYLLTRVRHRIFKSNTDLEAGALSPRCSYDNSFDCIPREVPFRPPRATPRPRVAGVQTAVVVGPAREEIYTDKEGRVKILFHWDRTGRPDGKSSCWVRVSQAWAGPGFGALWLPRVGEEVLVDFLEGDPDRPIIVGRVYHAQNLPPVGLPEHKTQSLLKSRSSPGGGGYNELRFEDRKGAEEVLLHAQRDLREEVGHRQSTSVGGARDLQVGGDRAVTVKGGDSLEVRGGRAVQAGGDLKVTVQGDHAEETTGAYRLRARSIDLVAEERIRLSCGAGTVTLRSDGSIHIEGGSQVVVKGTVIKLN